MPKATTPEPTDLQKMLAGFDEDYEKAEAFVQVPDGIYQAVIQRFDFLAGRDNHTYLKTEFQIGLGPHAGKTESTLNVLTNPDRFNWTKGYLETIGIEGPLSELESQLPSALDCPVELEVYTTNGKAGTKNEGQKFRNVRINQRLGGPISENVTPKSDIPDDDIPF